MKSGIQLFLENLLNSLLSVFKVMLQSKLPHTPKKLNIKEPVIILGNGPSLKSSLEKDTAFLKKSVLMSVNFFANTPYYIQLKPKFYVLNGPEFWLPDVDEVHITNRNELFDNLNRLTDWPINLFIPHEAKKHMKWEHVIDNKNFSIHYFNKTPVEGFDFLNFFYWKHQLGMPRPHNVLIPAILLCIKMKFKKIHLIGADHSWLKHLIVDHNNVARLSYEHFYDQKNSKAEIMKKYGQGRRTLPEILEKFLYSFKGYHELEKLARHLNVDIYNSTTDSMIDAFRRKKLNSN